ncbi:MAG TPA: SDR family NAD(P)-dependent oxidoreductase [Burkholderiales bacterium]|nr:SDR family NAD(P)-dependent oxidoreductase [Burkholderiales bacterium]
MAERVALITGAAGAIGSATAVYLARRGAAVALADAVSTQAVAERVEATGARCKRFALNVTRRDEIDAVVAQTLIAYGRIDILVNVAGIVSFGSAADLDPAEWDRVLDINLKGTFQCCQAVLPAMKAQRFGRIINLGSVLGKNGGNARPWLDAGEQRASGNVAYGASKAGVHAITAYLARELAPHGTTVNAVAPGPVASAMTTNLSPSLTALIPVGRMGTPEDVAAVIGFLASDEAAFVTGEVLDVNGGMWCD